MQNGNSVGSCATVLTLLLALWSEPKPLHSNDSEHERLTDVNVLRQSL
jgi:hypothetical protein